MSFAPTMRLQRRKAKKREWRRQCWRQAQRNQTIRTDFKREYVTRRRVFDLTGPNEPGARS